MYEENEIGSGGAVYGDYMDYGNVYETPAYEYNADDNFNMAGGEDGRDTVFNWNLFELPRRNFEMYFFYLLISFKLYYIKIKFL